MKPSLPQNDSLKIVRDKQLERAKTQYEFDYSYEDLANAKEVPFKDKSDPRYWAGIGGHSLAVSANKALWKKDDKIGELTARFKGLFEDATPEEFGGLQSELTKETVKDIDTTRPEDPQAYEEMFVKLRKPPVAEHWKRDDIFAWQAIAGYNPTMLTRLTAPWDHFRVTESHYAKAIGSHDSLEKAMAEGRLYTTDYKLFDGIPGGAVDGHQKYLTAPIALFSWQPARDGVKAMLQPVAIQCGQTPDIPIFTPADGISWRMARTAVQVAESQQGGLIVHFGLCHLVMESVTLSARRMLAKNHPLALLMEPHFEHTLIANEITKSSLVNPGGIIDRLQAPSLSDSLAVCRKGLSQFKLTESAPPKDFASRGVDSVDMLPEYPFRDDSLLVWEAMHAWVDGYVRLYYRSNEDIALDTELAAFVRELGSPDGGRLSEISAVETVDEVVDLIAQIIFRASAYHASINYPLYDFCFAPSGPTAGYGPGPTGTEADTEEALRHMLPPEDIAYESVAIYYPLQLKLNELGQYDKFADERVAPLLKTLQAQLHLADNEIRRRNETRPLPYLYYAPTEATQSIHV